MDTNPLDDATVDALFDGTLAPAKAPEGLATVAALFQAAAAPNPHSALAGERPAVAAIAATVRGEDPEARRVGATRERLAKVAAIATFVALGGGAVAAAAGTLPGPVQKVVSRGFANVGVEVPAPTDRPDMPHTSTTVRHERALTAPSSRAQAKGLCVAYRNTNPKAPASAKRARAVAFQRLALVATKHDETVKEYCDRIAPPHTPPASIPVTVPPTVPPTHNGPGGTVPGPRHGTDGRGSSGSGGSGSHDGGGTSGGDRSGGGSHGGHGKD